MNKPGQMIIDTSVLHLCCGEYWAGMTCRRCGKHFIGGGQMQTLPASRPKLREDAWTAIGARKQPRRKNKPKAANGCHVCGKTLPPPMEIAESLICDKCKGADQ